LGGSWWERGEEYRGQECECEYLQRREGREQDREGSGFELE
jgi:hypothetical protein